MRTPVLGKFPRIQCFAASLLLTLLIVPTIVAQTQITTGTIQGTVVDANGAAVPGAVPNEGPGLDAADPLVAAKRTDFRLNLSPS